MLRVRDIMTPEVVTLQPDQTLREAIETLVTCRIGGAPVVDGSRVVGVLSATDVLEFESVTKPAEQREEEPVEEAEEPLEEWREGEEWSSSYFTDLWTNREPDVAARLMAPNTTQWDLLEAHTVGEAMSRSVCTVPPLLEVSSAAQRMLAANVQRALVADSEGFVGILTTTDILRAVAEHRLTVRQFVFPQ